MDREKSLDSMSIENRIALMTLYRDEWKYRDQAFASSMWRFVTLSLIITFLPHVLAAGEMVPALAQAVPMWMFPLFGMISSLLGWYLGRADNTRITNIDNVYKTIRHTLPEGCEPDDVKMLIFKPRMNNLLCTVMYGATFILAAANFAFYI